MTHGVRAKHAREAQNGAKERLKSLQKFYQDGLDAADDGLHLPKWALDEKDYLAETRRVKREMARPEDMSLKQLKAELMKRKIYKPGLEKYVLVTLLKEVYAHDSRILRLNAKTQDYMYTQNNTNHEKLKKVLDESKTIRKRIQEAEEIDQAMHSKLLNRLKKKGRIVFLSLGSFQAAIDTKRYSTYELEQSIFILDCKRANIFRPKDAPYIDKYHTKETFCCIDDFQSSIILRAEEFGRVFFWKDKKKFTAIGEMFQKLIDPVTGKKYNDLKKVLKPFFWHSKWGEESDHKPKYTSSQEKVIFNFKSGSFEERSVAELLFHANMTLRFGMLLPWREEKQRKMNHKLRIS